MLSMPSLSSHADGGSSSGSVDGGPPGKDDSKREGRGDRAPPRIHGEADERPAEGGEAPPPRRDDAEDADGAVRSDPPGAYRVFPSRELGNSRGGRPPADDSEDPGPSPELQVSDATLVEEAEVRHAAPLEPPPTLWRHERIRLLAAMFCVVVMALSIGLGLSLSAANEGSEVDEAGDRSAEVEEVVVRRTLPPSTLRSSPPTTSSLPSSRPSMPSVPFITCSEYIKVCYPKVAMHGDTAMVTRNYIDVQFFTTTNSSFELVTRIQIDFSPLSVALNGDTAVITSINWTHPGDLYVYERDQYGIWSQAAQLRPGGLSMGFRFPVAIDGDIIVLGVSQRFDFFSNILTGPMPGERVSGYVYVYRRNGTAWTEEAKLTPRGNAAAKFVSGHVSVRGTSIAVGDYFDGNEDEGAVYVYEFNPSSNSWTPVSGALVNSDCGIYFGSIVGFTNDEGMLVKCGDDKSGVNAVYYYEKQETGEDYVLRQRIGFKEDIGSMVIDGKAMAVSEYRAGRSLVIHFFVLKNHAWEEVATTDEPVFDQGSFGMHIALVGNSTLIASWENVYLVQDYFNS